MANINIIYLDFIFYYGIIYLELSSMKRNDFRFLAGNQSENNPRP